MAMYDSADLLRRCKNTAKRPSTDAEMDDDAWYDLLTQAQSHWVPQLAAHVPEVLYSAPVQMTSTDGGYTYQIPGDADVWPMGRMEIRESRRGRILVPGADWDEGADIVPEGRGFRVPNGRTRTFSDGPWARYVASPGTISATSEPTFQPVHARMLLVYRACVEWANQGGLRDPAPYLQMEQKAWSGDPQIPGDTGILGSLKTALYGAGMQAIHGQPAVWYHSPDLGR